MTPTFVQIVNEEQNKAVSFAFDGDAAADAFADDLCELFGKHQVSGVIGRYDAGEVCPRNKDRLP
jgi:hypothetical protein